MKPPTHPAALSRRAALTRLVWATLATVSLAGCAAPSASPPHRVQDWDTPIALRLEALGGTDVLVLGEQHDAPEHQRQHQAAVRALADQGALGAVVLEMAEAGHDTRSLAADATEPQVRQALGWRQEAWPWDLYGPAVMAAVAAGVPVHGGNLPRQRNALVMKEAGWDTRVNADVLARQRDAVKEGHCDLLLPSQIGPMTRIQLARDAQMAATAQAVHVPGLVVLVLAGSQHAHKVLGVPAHLPPTLKVKTVRLAAGGPRPGDAEGFDAVWTTPPVPSKDHCATLKRPG